MRSPVHAFPNVTPMVDVMLVLLVIFMVVTPLFDGFVAEPPQGANLEDHPKDSTDVVLAIDASGRYYLDKQPIDSAVLGRRLESLFARSGSDHVMYLKADRALEYARVLAAMNVARHSGARVVGLITRKPPEALH